MLQIFWLPVRAILNMTTFNPHWVFLYQKRRILANKDLVTLWVGRLAGPDKDRDVQTAGEIGIFFCS